MERFVQEAHASFAGAEGLRNVPLYVLHGDAMPPCRWSSRAMA